VKLCVKKMGSNSEVELLPSMVRPWIQSPNTAGKKEEGGGRGE
jgi:hypothetical protein